MKIRLYCFLSNQTIECDVYDDNIKIIDSYLINDDASKKLCIEFILDNFTYIDSRTLKDMLYEWRVHNWCYRHNIKRESTKDTDLELHQNIFLKLIYRILGKTICKND